MNVSIDSRTVKPGDYFIPVKGPTFDGRDFISEAIQKGAHILDVDLFSYAKAYRKKLNCTVVGIVGSAGKTTVKDMLGSILGKKVRVTKTKENQNNEYGVPLTILSADTKTDILLVEMAMRNAEDLTFLTKIVQPDIIVFTGVGKTHIENFSSQKELAKAKAEVFRRPLKWQQTPRLCFMNSNGACHNRIQAKASKVGYQIITYSGEDKVSENINVCYQVGIYFGLTNIEIEDGVTDYRGSSHRMSIVEKKGITILDDTYNSNPCGVKYALQFMRRFKGRKIVVLGDMLELGSESEDEHKKIETLAINEEVEMMFLYGEQTKVITSQTIATYHFETINQLNQQLITELKVGDNVLVKGSRELEMEQVVTYINEQLS